MITTHARLQRMLELPCRCPKSYVHAACTGKVAEGSGVFTPEYAQRVAKSVLQELEYQGVQQESQGRSKLLETFGNGETCFCKDLQIPSLPEQKCTSCWPRALGIQASGTSDRFLEASGRGSRYCPGKRPPGVPGALWEYLQPRTGTAGGPGSL